MDDTTKDEIIVPPRRKHSKWAEKNQNKVKLEHVLGFTIPSNAALDCDSSTGVIAYPAGCAVVFLSLFKDKQTHLFNLSRKTITCLKYSPDGRYLATGEYGHQPSIRVWDLADNTQCAEFTGHKCGVNNIIFSPNQKYLVSVGSQHDMIINVWDWKAQIKIASSKVSAKVKAVSFSESGDYFVTVGNRLVKFWYLQSRQNSFTEPMPLMGRSAILGEQRNNDFVDVTYGRYEYRDMTYVITRTGILCEFNGRRLLNRWVDIKANTAYCIETGDNLIFIGCSDAIIRCFSAITLEFVTTLPRTHYLGVDVASALNISHTSRHPPNAKYPDTIAVTYDEVHKKLSCIYNDHSLYIWDINDVKKVGKSHSCIYHCACIWGVEIYPELGDDKESMPLGSFITCSSDDTIRVWNLNKYRMDCDPESPYQPNIYSNELLKVIYIDPHLQYLKDSDIGLSEKIERNSYDGRNGVRSLGMSDDGEELATGDRSGNIRIYNLKNVEEICKIEAHDAEVLCLEYSPRSRNRRHLLASASRDRLIHIFDASDDYNFLETLDDHSSSITAVKFFETNGELQLVSCSADKSIIFRKYQDVKSGHFIKERIITGKSTLYDMAVDCSQKYILTGCQDRNIRVYNIANGKHSKTFKGSMGEDGSIIKVALDASGRYVATSCTDKTLCIYDYYSGDCIACICGHSELVTGLRFTKDCERLISASGDGCIFVWRLPRDMVVTMQARMVEQSARANKSLAYERDDFEKSAGFNKHPKRQIRNNLSSEARFDADLPLWVMKSMSEEHSVIVESSSSAMVPKGRWAQRLEVPLTKENIRHLSTVRDSDGSKEDSSVDSGTETSRPEDRHEKLIVPQKMIRSPPKFITVEDAGKDGVKDKSLKNVTDAHDSRLRQHTDDSSLGSFRNEDIESMEHDGDIEDYSEVESGENENHHKVIYYASLDDTRDYTVNAIDVDELRKSQRKMKRNLLAKKSSSALNAEISVSGSQESDLEEDDDGGSIPSADNSERNTLSLNSTSADNVEAFIQREKYLKSTYESLSGAEMDVSHLRDKKSISSKHHSYADAQNQKLIQNVCKNRDNDTYRIRRQLNSRIEDIREKLQGIGYHSSSLKSSQSTMDLRKGGESFFVPASPSSAKGREEDALLQGTPLSSIIEYAGTNPRNRVTNPVSRKIGDGCRNESTRANTTPWCNVRETISSAATRGRPDYLLLSGSEKRGMVTSLPQSPVCRTPHPPVKQYSCSFFVEMNGVDDEGYGDFGVSGEEYSSDSLEDEDSKAVKCAARRNRCVSEYRVSWKSDSKDWNSPFEADFFNRSHSEENILNNEDSYGGGHRGGCGGNGRYSSASFFLRKGKVFDSVESVATTDESEYQYLFSNRDTVRSMESILTDASEGNLPADEVDSAFGPPSGVLSRSSSCRDRDHRKNESFFVPLDEGGDKVTPLRASPLRRLTRVVCKRAPNDKGKSDKDGLKHPVVVHKPPPKGKPVANVKKPAIGKCVKDFEKAVKKATVKRTDTFEKEDRGKHAKYQHGTSQIPLKMGHKNVVKRRVQEIDAMNNNKMKWDLKSGGNLKRLSLPASANNTLAGKIPPVPNYEDGYGMRRSCSLSDLSAPDNAVITNKRVPNKLENKNYSAKNSFNKHYEQNMSTSRNVVNNAFVPSVYHAPRRNVRYQNDTASASRIMKPTISSQNKSKSSAPLAPSRSVANLSRRRLLPNAQVEAGLEDSSSEDSKSRRNGKKFSKFLDHRSNSEMNLSTLHAMKKKHQQQYYLNVNLNDSKSELNLYGGGGRGAIITGGGDTPLTAAEVTDAPLSADLLNTVVDQFKKTAENIMLVHDRLTRDNAASEREKQALLVRLRSTIGKVQTNLLSKLTAGSEGEEARDNPSPPNLNNQDSDKMMSIIQQYSDELLSLVQKKADKR